MPRRRSYGSVYRKRRPDGTLLPGFYARWVEGGRRIARGGFATRDAAETWLAGRRTERSQRRALGMPDVSRVAVAVAVPEYQAWMRLNRRPRTEATRRAPLRLLVALLGPRDVSSISSDDLLRVIERGRATLGWLPSSQAAAATALGGFCTWAVSRGYASQTPATGLHRRLPRPEHREPPYLEPDLLRMIYAAVPEASRAAVVLMGDAGLRKSEAVYLEHGEVSADRRRIVLRAERVKTGRGRTIPLTERAREELSRVLDAQATPTDRSARVFRHGPQRIARDLQAAVQRLGRPEITPHTLRHAFASGLMRSGADIATVMRLMGHTSLAVTQVYACHAPRDAAVRAIEALEASRTPVSDDGRGISAGT